MTKFRILTFVTDHDVYATMRTSFETAGLGSPDTVFQIVDNSVGNVSDPYSVLNGVLDTMTEDYLIFCHQDVRLAEGTTVATLLTVLDNADSTYPHWAVLGPAGLDLRYEHTAVVDDPWRAPRWPGPWPVEAEVLDEVLLVVRPGGASLSSGLRGFHFVAADLCVSARRGGGCALIVDLPIVHLSNGARGQHSPAYRTARDALQHRLSPEYHFRVLMAITSEAVVLSRWRVVRRFADRHRVRTAAIRWFGRRMVP